MLISDPRQTQPARSSSLVSSIDVAPTVLSMAGLQPFADIQGVDISGALRGEPVSRDCLLIEDDSYHVNTLGFTGQYRARTLQTDRYRMTVYLGGDWGELYDLHEDPLEITNLWDDDAHQATRSGLLWDLNQRMMDYCSRSPWPTWEA